VPVLVVVLVLGFFGRYKPSTTTRTIFRTDTPDSTPFEQRAEPMVTLGTSTESD
jgi:hypothetical protein